ncbi:motility associated factor glycosyltransferase family protein [Brevibacillus sp. SYP-B805]|uniref:motility associated factor glycosyltransferase family protein n=1 Tax=Brevibacillus sp. SYP-B805 TaxID=1578199 RepID=UPI0013E9C007|nr:6-hydroxymethylpterin diphosphokinase MptE-like protein [Brevibacillus sp. SYP-B805]NGQ95636.1 motility associated factor glycosyltransferase family protein [Brevibacillus sp. SYP-B805]
MFFQSNKQYFTEYNQWLIEQMEEIRTDDIETVRIGEDIVFKLKSDEGDEFYSGSIYDPVFEAKQFLDGVNFDNTAYVLMGIGSSAIVKQILENKTEAAWLLIIEKDVRLIKRFLEEVNLAPYLEGKIQRIIILSGLMENISVVINTYLTSLIGYYFLQTDILRTFASYRCDKEFYDDITQTLINHLRTHMTSMGNSLEDTLMGMTNELKNVPIALKSRRLKDLKDVYKGKPIICVSSGPSLDKQLPLLKQAKGKALIICAESALRVLLKNGITPDIVGILERGTNSYDISLAGIEIPEDTALMGLTLMDPRIPRAWNQYVVPIFKENIAHSRLLNKSLGDMGGLYNGNSVAHLNYALANYLGGSPIVFIGQDLAYSEEGRTHSKDSFYLDQSDLHISEQQRNQIRASLQEDNSFFNKTVYLDGYYGGKVKSKELWRQFLYWMEHLISVLPNRLVINSTEGGADIKGTVKMPFLEVLETYCKEPIPSIPELFAELPPIPSDEEITRSVKGMIDTLNQELGEMERVALFAEEILESGRKLQEELAAEQFEFVEMKASRIFRNVESLLIQVLKNPLLTFFYRPLLSNYHVKMNPISRVSSIDRLKQILTHQCYLLQRMIQGKVDVMNVYKNGVREAVTELGLDPDEFCLDPQPSWELPEWDEYEEAHA